MGRSSPSISACLIARDEEAFIERCLASIKGAVDEIVVVDTGSVDRTPELARGHGARVIERPWPEDFSVARNWALEEASGDWVFVIDADEELVAEDAGKLRQLAASGLADGYLVNVHHFAEDEDQHVITQHVALFRNDRRFRYKGAIHEQVGNQITEAGGRLMATDVRVVHKGYEASVIAAKRKHERNLKLLQRELERNPTDPVLHYYIAQEYYGSGRLVEAAAEYEKTFALAGPKWTSRHVVPGVIRYSLTLAALERWGEAFELLERYRTLYPKSSDLHYLQAVLALRVGDPAWAVGLLAQAIAYGDPPPGMFELTLRGTGSYKAWFEMGQAYERLHQRDKAAGAYLEAVRAEPKYAKAVKALTVLLLETDPAERVVAFLLDRIASRELRPIDGLWEALLNVGAYREALDVLYQLSDRYEAERALRQGITHLAMGEATTALQRLETALAHERTRDVAAVDGVLAAIAAGKPSLAWRFLQHVNPDRLPAAVELLERVLRRLPADELVTLQAGALAATTGGKGASSFASDGDALARARLDGFDGGSIAAQAAGWQLVRRAVAFRLFEVVDLLVQEMVEQGLPRAEAALTLGKILHGSGYREVGLDLLVDATRQGRYDVEALMMLARAAFDRGDREGAEALLRKAVEVAEKHPLPMMALAALLAETGRPYDGLVVLDEAIRANPYAGLLKEQRERLARQMGVHSRARWEG